MIYRGPGFLGVESFASSPTPSHQQVVSLTQSSCVSPLAFCRRGERGWVRSQIRRRRESLVLYKSFNTLWVHTSHKHQLFNDDISIFFSSSVIFPPQDLHTELLLCTHKPEANCVAKEVAIPRKIACFQPCKILGLASIRRGENITIL
jgi:hypothetical protein